MKTTGPVLAAILLLAGLLFTPWSNASARTVGFNNNTLFYNYTTTTYNWTATDGDRLKADTTSVYASTYGDEAKTSFTLPWSFPIWGAPYNGTITADTNGRIWFGDTDSSPYIAAWEEDLSSYFYGGVFIQRMTVSGKDAVVVEWQTETYTDEGYYLPNKFEVVLFADGTIRYNYNSFTASVIGQGKAGIFSGGDGIDLTAYGWVPLLGGRSFLIRNQVPLNVTIVGTGEGTVQVNPGNIVGSISFSTIFPLLQALNLTATPSEYSLFTGWSGACSGTGSCSQTMDTEKAVTTTFNRDTAHQTKVDETNYPSIQAAYNASQTNDTIKLWGVTFFENVLCDLPKDVTFDGGYNGDYTSKTGETVLKGTLTLTNGLISPYTMVLE